LTNIKRVWTHRQYTNAAKREINIIALTYDRGPEISHAHVVFDASVLSLSDNEEINHSHWRADISYKYTDFEVDQSLDQQSVIAKLFGLTGNTVQASGEKHKVIPMTFMVRDYQVKELLE
jgi:type IV secretory pathway component VirB8